MVKGSLTKAEMKLSEKLWQVNWTMIFLILAVAVIGFGMLYSAAKGSMDPWASRQMTRFALGIIMMFACLRLIRKRDHLRKSSHATR